MQKLYFLSTHYVTMSTSGLLPIEKMLTRVGDIDSLLVCKSTYGTYLEMYPRDIWEPLYEKAIKLEERIGRLARPIARGILHPEKLDIDDHKRVKLSADLISHAGLVASKKATSILGNIDHIEVWNVATMADQELTSDQLQKIAEECFGLLRQNQDLDEIEERIFKTYEQAYQRVRR